MRRRMVLLMAAALLALAGTGALWHYVSGAEARALTGKEAIGVLVAADAIPAGTDFAAAQEQGLVETVDFPRGAVPAGTFTDAAQAAGLIATRAVEPRELLTATTFGPAAATEPVTGGVIIPAGKVALPVSFKHFANSPDWAAYFQSGAEIALFDTYTSDDASRTPQIGGLVLNAPNLHLTRLLVDRVAVIGVSGAPDATAGSTGSAVVLAVDQRQAEQIVLSLFNGTQLYPVLLTSEELLAPSPGTANPEIFDATGSTP